MKSCISAQPSSSTQDISGKGKKTKVFSKLQKQKEKEAKKKAHLTPSPTHSKKKEGKEKDKSANREKVKKAFKPIFGVDLEVSLSNNRSHDGVCIPAFVRSAIDYVRTEGLRTEGIYRISPNKTQLDDLRFLADRGVNPTFSDPHAAAAFLKMFLREIPDHILSHNLNPQFEKAASECICKTPYCTCLAGDRIKALLLKLPKPNYAIVAYLFIHLREVIRHERQTKMGLDAVGLVMQATLSMNQRLLTIFLENTHTDRKQATSFFTDVFLKKYVPPLRPSPERLEESLPKTKQEIEEELGKQQSLLGELHEEIQYLPQHQQELNSERERKEQELWEVQMVATQLRRKLKTLKQREEKKLTSPRDERLLSDSDKGPCLEMFVEKQLLATQWELKNRISEEKKAIRSLEAAIEEAKLSCKNKRTPPIEEEAPHDEERYKVKYGELVNRKEFLLAEVIRERKRCAHLQAEIEFLTLSKQNKDTRSSKTALPSALVH